MAICRLLASSSLAGGHLESFSVIYFGTARARSGSLRVVPGSTHNDCECAAPIKALCTEMMTNFSEKFAVFGLTCGELTGDIEDMRAATKHPIVCATPEKVRH